MKDVFIKPPKLNLDPNQLLKISKLLYGLLGNGDYSETTLGNRLEKDLGMISYISRQTGKGGRHFRFLVQCPRI